MKKDFNPRFAYFLHEKEREEQARKVKKYIDEEEMYLKYFIKNVFPLMSIKDLVGCLVAKTCDKEGAILTGIPYGEDVYEVQIKKMPKKD